MKPVKIRCLPAGRPDDEKIDLTFPSGHLLEKVGTTYQAAQSSYKANEIGGKSFWLLGHEPSWAERDRVILAEHNINGCKDEAKYTVVKVDLDIWNGGSDLDNGQTAGSQGAQVPEDSEVSIGAYLLVNWDDDDADGTMNADGTWSALPLPDLTENSVANEDNLEEHNDFDLIGWADTFMPATQCGNVAPDEAATRLARQNLCQPIGSTGGN